MPVRFPTTACSLLLDLEQTPEDRRRTAERLCALYRAPIQAYLEHALRLAPADADDVTQEVFVALLSGPVLKGYARERGPFRRYLTGVLRNFARRRARSERAVRRGGQNRRTSLDDAAEVAGPEEDPARAFDVAWVKELVRQALARLRTRLTAEGREEEFSIFEAYEFPEPGSTPTYRSLAGVFDTTEARVRHALSSARERLRQELRLQLSETVTTAAELEAEWESLFQTGS